MTETPEIIGDAQYTRGLFEGSCFASYKPNIVDCVTRFKELPKSGSRKQGMGA